MGAFKDKVYWKEQCAYCANRMCCKYRDWVELLRDRLVDAEEGTGGCYGTLSYWCDYFIVDVEWRDANTVSEVRA